MIFFIPLLFSAINLTFAQTAPSKCNHPAVLRVLNLDSKPNYFVRVDSKAKKIFTSGDCTYSLENGKCIPESQGRTWEPYPISGFNLLTVPHCKEQPSMCFYSTAQFKNQTNSSPLYVDEKMKGYYQSIGFLKRNNDSADVRVISYYGVFRDYKVSTQSVSPISDVQKFCPHQDLKLPMLSKDASKISAWNESLKKTIIYSLEKSGNCKPYFTIDSLVGKMDFDYHNKFAAYHAASESLSDVENYLENKQDIVLMELSTKKTYRFSDPTHTLYFPHFAENGLMYVLKYNKSQDKYSLLEIDPNKLVLNKNLPTLCNEPASLESTIQQ